MNIKLHLHKKGQIQHVALNQEKTEKLPFESDAQYQFWDENQQAPEMRFEKRGDEVWFWLAEQPLDTPPILILYEADGFVAAMHFPQMAVKASEVSSLNPYVVLGTLGLLGVGVAVAAERSSDDGKILFKIKIVMMNKCVFGQNKLNKHEKLSNKLNLKWRICKINWQQHNLKQKH